MALDLLLPFGILLVLVVYLIYTRGRFEKELVNTYEEKFESWKEHHSKPEETTSCKELVGLVFKENGKIEVETFDQTVQSRMERGKFTTKVK